MTPAQILADLCKRGIRYWRASKNRFHCKGPVTNADLHYIDTHKAELLELLPDPNAPKPIKSDPRFIAAFDKASKSIPPSPTWTQDAGIVIAAGGWRFFPSLYVTVAMIRETGCKLPVQVWHLPGEREPAMVKALEPFGVEWVDAAALWTSVAIDKLPLDHGWMLKAFAAAHAPFSRVLSLDADCYPVSNLTAFLDDPRTIKQGSVFFADLGNFNLRADQWRAFGLPPRLEPAFETGIFLVDKAQHWEPLWLTLWLNAHHAKTYSYIYGDKDTFHIAWRKLGQDYGMPSANCWWTNIAFCHRGWDQQEPLVVHRCRGKFQSPGRSNFTSEQWECNKTHNEFPLEATAHRFCEDANAVVPVADERWLGLEQPPLTFPVAINSTALVTVVSGWEAEELFRFTKRYMRAYAERIGADFIVLTWPGTVGWPMSAKFSIGGMLNHYDRIAYVDADVLIRPKAVNLFQQCHASQFGICDELREHRCRGGDSSVANYKRFRRMMGFASCSEPAWLGNCGVMVASKIHQRVLDTPSIIYLGGRDGTHSAEQNLTCARLTDWKCKVKLMDRRCNWQRWFDNGWSGLPEDALMHWSGTDHATRILELKQWTARSPLT